jgi:hypothetical protein
MKNRTVVFQFKNGETMALTKTFIEKTSNAVKFIGCQLPSRLILAGTVLRSQQAGIDYHTKFWEHRQLYVALSRVQSPVDLYILLPDDMDDFTIRPPVDLDVVQILEMMESSRALPMPQISPGDNVESGIGSVDPSGATLAKNSLAPMTTSTLPRTRLIVFPVSIMILLKYLIPVPVRYPSRFRSCHGSVRTNSCFDLIVSEISYLKAIYPDLLCLLQRFSVG